VQAGNRRRVSHGCDAAFSRLFFEALEFAAAILVVQIVARSSAADAAR
jgi:hypothetical protein